MSMTEATVEPRSVIPAPAYIPPATVAQRTQMTAFTEFLERKIGSSCPTYADLHAFSVQDTASFWRYFLEWAAIRGEGSVEPVLVGKQCEHAVFFPDLRLNYTDNLLALTARYGLDHPALIACRADGIRESLNRRELIKGVARTAQGLRRLGVSTGDRIAAVLRNNADAIVVVLACAGLGATVSTLSPDMGADTIFARLQAVTPRWLIAHTAPLPFDHGTALAERVADVASRLSSLAGVVAIDDESLLTGLTVPVHSLAAITQGRLAPEFDWPMLPFNHPLFVMFSSGTTGPAKCIVHGAGGTLLEHIKEHRLHCDLTPSDRLFFQTSCAWMMWNWQLSALAGGVEIVLYDGPVDDARRLWSIVAREQVTAFGTSPAYLRMCEDAGLVPAEEFDLSSLRAMFSTGSILYDRQYDWVRGHVKSLPLQSISGGTDIIGCFVLGNPNLPVYPGESQCKSLGLDVRAITGDDGSGIGELVCANPFPSRPLGFLGDDGTRFHTAYFSKNPGFWTHGDLISFTEHEGARLHGRSDGVLNVRGINVGPAEIYRALQDLPEVVEGLAVEQQSPDDPEQTRVVMLVVLRNGIQLDAALARRIRRHIAQSASAAHVPDVILQVEELPTTHSGKRSEAAAREAVNLRPVRNIEALRNPESLEIIGRQATARPWGALPPQTDAAENLERYLQTLWEALFGVAPIGPDEDFFELGGNSLTAARLIAEIRQATGRDLPLTTLIYAPTIVRLAAIIRDKSWRPSSVLVQLRSGSENRPFFLVHGLSGTVMELWALGRALTTRSAVYGLQARGLDPDETPHRTIQEMAAYYLDAIRPLQPHGPYALGGFSYGGLIAFEMAQCLTRAGESVEFVLLFDTSVTPRVLPWPERARLHGKRLGRQALLLAKQKPREWPIYLRDKGQMVVDGVRMRFALSPKHTDWTIRGLVIPPFLQRIRDSARTASANYQPSGYYGKVVLFRAAEREIPWGDPAKFWRHVALGPFEIHTVPGNHNSMVLEPHVRTLARLLDEYLAQENRMPEPASERAA